MKTALINTPLKSIGGLLLMAIATSFVASGIFLALINRPVDSAMPWTIWQYYYYYGDRAPVRDTIAKAYLGAGVPLALFLVALFRPKRRQLHGSARWAHSGDLKQAGLFSDTGLLLAHHNGRPLMSDGPFHALLEAETRAGKGVSFVIPVCLFWKGSLVVLDMKQENHDLTSGFRRRYGQSCYLFNPSPRDYATHRFNALGYIPDDPNARIDMIQKISHHLSPTPPGKDPIWTSEARKLFEGLALLVCDLDHYEQTLGQIFRILHTEKKTHDYLQEVIDTYRDQLDPLCIMNLSGFIQTVDKTRSGIKAQLTSVLNMFANPMIDAATAANDFDLRALKHEKMSVYVAVTPDNLIRMSPLINLFFQLTIDLNTAVLPKKDPNFKHQVMLLPDEFTSIGPMDVLAKGIAFIAGYGIRLVPIVQSQHQLYETYGAEAAKNMIKQFHVRVHYTPNDYEDAESISKELGTITVKQNAISQKRGWSPSFDRNVTTSETKRALLLPQEVKELPKDKCIIFIKNTPPIQADRYFYYSNPIFKQRLFEPAKVPMIQVEKTKPAPMIAAPYRFNFDEVELDAPIHEDRILSDAELDQATAEFWSAVVADGHHHGE